MSKNIFSNEAFADWCERQGNKAYKYVDCEGCAIHQYLCFLGFNVSTVALNHWLEAETYIRREFPDEWRELANSGYEEDNTFSRLATRLRNFIGERV